MAIEDFFLKSFNLLLGIRLKRSYLRFKAYFLFYQQKTKAVTAAGDLRIKAVFETMYYFPESE